jgi:hypothetical protein
MRAFVRTLAVAGFAAHGAIAACSAPDADSASPLQLVGCYALAAAPWSDSIHARYYGLPRAFRLDSAILYARLDTLRRAQPRLDSAQTQGPTSWRTTADSFYVSFIIGADGAVSLRFPRRRGTLVGSATVWYGGNPAPEEQVPIRAVPRPCVDSQQRVLPN